ncbi:MAG: GAF domain-containing sensor histidine kinase [Chloroflexota bacterium]|nr:GAF domain-containing sensor histidine kinase [Chloroflexota bacterium]
MTDLVDAAEARIDKLAQAREELSSAIFGALRATLFESRAFIRPKDLRRLSSEETDAFFGFLADGESSSVADRGKRLCHRGVGDLAVLRIGQVLRRFVSDNTSEQDVIDLLEAAEGYHRALLQGYLGAQRDIILEEQERIRFALQQTLHRYTIQVQTASEVAQATISTLDLGELLTTAVDLIGERFSLDYVGVYLVDEAQQYAILRAAIGLAGRRRMATGHRLRVVGPSTVGRCIKSRQHLLVNDISGAVLHVETSWVEGVRSEIALPLITRDSVIGALTVQSNRASAFSSLDVPGFQIMGDQVANAIANARLYAAARRRADELSLAYERLKDLEELKDQFVQNVSHELKTPLTLVTGYADAMKAAQLGPITPEQMEALEVISRSSSALGDLFDDILTILQVSASRPSIIPISLAEVAGSRVVEFEAEAREKDITIEADLRPSGQLSFVVVRPNHIRRIVDNLLSNAVKFTPSGGQVLVRVWEGEDQVFLDVSDSGIGIPLEAQDRVFDRFFQVDGSVRRRFGGTGLGLALVRELVEYSGGTVAVSSPGVNQGTTFTVAFPAAQI